MIIGHREVMGYKESTILATTYLDVLGPTAISGLT
jgi:hypothetical protein